MFRRSKRLSRKSLTSCPTARHSARRWLGWCAALAVALLVAGAADAAVDEHTLRLTPPRLALVEGDVSFWRPGAGDWESAQVNVPLAPGDALATRDGRLELQIGSGSFARAGEASQLRVKSLEPDFLQLDVTQGSVVLDLRQLASGFVVEVDTPSARFTTVQDGYYRVDVGTDSTRLAVRRAGAASLTPAGGHPVTVGTGEAVVVSGGSAGTFEVVAAAAFDEWDRWNYDRGEQRLAAPRSYSVAAEVYGADELERYGNWRYTSPYGRVWVPYSVPSGWAPYTNGRWLNDPVYGYSWVDYSPWGWAPYHYGRWVYAGYWGWAPGPVVFAPLYSPALVAFYGPSVSVGVGYYGVPYLGWTALSWGEPLIPWWGPVGFIGSPCWWGWGGPRVVNNIYINNGDNVSSDQVNLYRNARAPGGLVGVPKDRFPGGSVPQSRLASLNSRDVKPWRGGALPVAGARQVGAMGSPPAKTAAIDGAAPGSKGGAFSTLAAQRPSAAAARAAQATELSRNPTALQRSRASGGPPPLANMPKADSTGAFERLSERSSNGTSTLSRRGAGSTDLRRNSAPGGVGAQPKAGAPSAAGAPPKGAALPPFERLRSASNGSAGATSGVTDQRRGGRRYASTEPPALQRAAPPSDGGSRASGWSKGDAAVSAPTRLEASQAAAPSAPAAASGSASVPETRSVPRSLERAPSAEFRGAVAKPSMPSVSRDFSNGAGRMMGGSSGGSSGGGGGGGMRNFSR